jgi:glycosyltransferase involved in cell wall biosynthesis
MPMAVEASPDSVHHRPDFALGQAGFTFLFLFDWNSFVARKNPAAVVGAFRRAFPESDQNVSLVLKTMMAQPDSHGFRDLCALIEHDPRIRIINEPWSRGRTLGLISVCDAMVSLHRAEGFGRTLAEAMALGTPVIATGWSGNLDFCNGETAAIVPAELVRVEPGAYPFGEGRMWAEPDVQAAATLMQRVRSDEEYRLRLARNGQSWVADHYDIRKVGHRYRERLEAIRCGITASI